MLKKIICDKFLKKEICFHEGLNTIVGDDIASNSIGKSTMLMIIDFVFGGDDYITKNSDAIDALGHHRFMFEFVFDDVSYFFSRSTEQYKYIYWCNDKYELLHTTSVEEFAKWLQTKYNCLLDELSFRNIIGRYFRVYGRENLNERKPIQYFEKEKPVDSITALLKLFDQYKVLKSYEEQIKKLKEEQTALKNAVDQNLIPAVKTKSGLSKSKDEIERLSIQLEQLKKEVITNSVDVEAMVTREVLDLRKRKSRLLSDYNKCFARLERTRGNSWGKQVDISKELSQLIEYFPTANLQKIQEIDSFHKQLTLILKDELISTEKELQDRMKMIQTDIDAIDEEISNRLAVKDAPKIAINTIVELVSQISQLQSGNANFERQIQLGKDVKATEGDLKELKSRALDFICNTLNQKMAELNRMIYDDGRRAPTINIHGNKYSFVTIGDTGTGTAYANLISFDLAILELTALPALAHDLPLLKNIENQALANIFILYERYQKQIFVAIDKLISYDSNTVAIAKKHMVLELAKDKLLFVKNWKKEG